MEDRLLKMIVTWIGVYVCLLAYSSSSTVHVTLPLAVFRALVEENVKENVLNVYRSSVIQEVNLKH